MTVIAWDGKTLAGDCCATYGSVRLTVKTKIQEVDGFLIGCSGCEPATQAFVAWFAAGCQKSKWPAAEWMNDLHALAIDPAGRAYAYWTCWMPSLQRGKIAIGSGYAVALSAMELGAGAKEAVRLASRIADGCAPPVRTLKRGTRKRFPVFDPTKDHRLLKGWLGKKEGG